METKTHLALSPRLCGAPRVLQLGSAEVELETTEEMRADERGLVHGGFIFGVADYAAMLAINEPNVVLGSAETRFLKPVLVGERVLARAQRTDVEGKRQHVRVSVTRGDECVMEGSFVCFVPARHVLDGRAGAVT